MPEPPGTIPGNRNLAGRVPGRTMRTSPSCRKTLINSSFLSFRAKRNCPFTGNFAKSRTLLFLDARLNQSFPKEPSLTSSPCKKNGQRLN